ncbi:MAG: S41 family peptidase, partial [Phycisphaerae bacterium]|nr:S41 family peptidase [Phycisphaerae bacterium]
FGKGSVQNVIELEDGQGAIKLTTAYYYLPGGTCIHKSDRAKETDKWGVEPKIKIVLADEEIIDVLKGRRDADIIHNGATQPTTTQAGHDLVIDRQLDQGIMTLVGVLTDRADRATRKAS